jgi:negative regulator of flagellin synthesis FlgM
MDIKNLTTNVAANRSNEAIKPQAKGTENNQTSPSNHETDRVTLTDVLSQARALETKSKNISIDNSEKVAAIKAAVNNGTYQIDSKRIAEKLIQTEALFAKA